MLFASSVAVEFGVPSASVKGTEPETGSKLSNELVASPPMISSLASVVGIAAWPNRIYANFVAKKSRVHINTGGNFSGISTKPNVGTDTARP